MSHHSEIRLSWNLWVMTLCPLSFFLLKLKAAQIVCIDINEIPSVFAALWKELNFLISPLHLILLKILCLWFHLDLISSLIKRFDWVYFFLWKKGLTIPWHLKNLEGIWKLWVEQCGRSSCYYFWKFSVKTQHLFILTTLLI